MRSCSICTGGIIHFQYQGDLSPREVELQTKLALTEKALKASKKKERDMKNVSAPMKHEGDVCQM